MLVSTSELPFAVEVSVADGVEVFEPCFPWFLGFFNGFSWIIKATTGKFPHWYRAVCETVYGKLVHHNDPWKLKKFMGLQRLENTVPYVSTEGKEAETLFKL